MFLNINFGRLAVKVLFFCFLISLFSCSQLIYGVPDVKKASVVGTFYPYDKDELQKTIKAFLDEVQEDNQISNATIWGLVVPHAGYDYSGKVAAHAYKQIRDKNYKTVIILGTSHYSHFGGAVIYPRGKWETPLGIIQVDTNVASKIQKTATFLKTYTNPFIPEHSIETQLPFLQMSLGNFKIVPILFGQMVKDEEYKAIASTLSTLIKESPGEILLIASTDLSHYHEYTRAKIMDHIAIKNITTLDSEKLKVNLEQRNCEMCSSSAIITLLMVADHFPSKTHLIYYANSGDTTGKKDSVVGYTAIAFSLMQNANLLNTSEQKTLLKIARKTLEKYIRNKVVVDYDIVDDRLKEKLGLFVTLKKNNELRGCIGIITPEKSIIDALIEMTITAATRDFRFPKVTPDELSDIKIEVSILSPLKKIENINEIEIGRHGLYLCNGIRCGILLPQVAIENNWDRDKLLEMVSLKAGLHPSAWKDKNSEIYTFTAQVFSE